MMKQWWLTGDSEQESVGFIRDISASFFPEGVQLVGASSSHRAAALARVATRKIDLSN